MNVSQPQAGILSSCTAPRSYRCSKAVPLGSVPVQVDGRERLPELPLPHPHDYDWRFGASTAETLTRGLGRLTAAGDRVLLLGAPSLLGPLLRIQSDVHPILVDRSGALMRYLVALYPPDRVTLVRKDMLADRGTLWRANSPADVVVCDPPWYVEHYTAFLTQAAYAARLGAAVIVSLLPVHTRPSAPADRQHILEVADALGFQVKTIEPGVLRYATPPFERASWRAANVWPIDEWRTGDMLILSKVAERGRAYLAAVQRAIQPDPFDTDDWEEVLFGQFKVKLRGPFDIHEGPPDLVPIESDNVLPSVSRRYEGRRHIDLWLWNNQVFAVRGRAALRAGLRALAGAPPCAAHKDVTIGDRKRAIALLAPLVAGALAVEGEFEESLGRNRR